MVYDWKAGDNLSCLDSMKITSPTHDAIHSRGERYLLFLAAKVLSKLYGVFVISTVSDSGHRPQLSDGYEESHLSTFNTF